jgi:hypothetical protein
MSFICHLARSHASSEILPVAIVSGSNLHVVVSVATGRCANACVSCGRKIAGITALAGFGVSSGDVCCVPELNPEVSA